MRKHVVSDAVRSGAQKAASRVSKALAAGKLPDAGDWLRVIVLLDETKPRVVNFVLATIRLTTTSSLAKRLGVGRSTLYAWADPGSALRPSREKLGLLREWLSDMAETYAKLATGVAEAERHALDTEELPGEAVPVEPRARESVRRALELAVSSHMLAPELLSAEPTEQREKG